MKRGFWRKEDSIGHREMKAHRSEKQEGRQILEHRERQWNRKKGRKRARQTPLSPFSLSSSNIQILDSGPRNWGNIFLVIGDQEP